MASTAQEHYVTVDGHRIRYLEAGSGAPILMFHGLGLDASADEWVYAMEPLAQDYRVIAVDRFGWGRSDRPTSGYSFPAWTAMVIGFMKELGIPKAILMGHTLGGWISALVAHEHPELVEKLVLVNVAGLNVNAPVSPEGYQLPDKDGVGAMLERTFGTSERVTEAMVDDHFDRISGPGVRDAYLAVLQYVNNPDVRKEWWLADRLPNVTTPTLVIWGANDTILTPEYGRQAAELLPNGNLVLIDEGSHIPQVRQTETFVSAVREFLG